MRRELSLREFIAYTFTQTVTMLIDAMPAHVMFGLALVKTSTNVRSALGEGIGDASSRSFCCLASPAPSAEAPISPRLPSPARSRRVTGSLLPPRSPIQRSRLRARSATRSPALDPKASGFSCWRSAWVLGSRHSSPAHSSATLHEATLW